MMRALVSRRAAIALLACLSAASTVLIVRAGSRRSSAQTAALAALAQKPQTITQAAAVTTTVVTPPTVHLGGGASGSGGSGSAGGGSGGSGGGGGASSSAARSGSSSSGSAVASAPSPTPTPTPTPTTSSTPAPTHHAAPAPDAGLPTVGHVFLITLSTSSYGAAFGAKSKLPYLRTLASRGALLENFRSLGHGELADELAMISGQKPNAATTASCPTFREFPSSAAANTAGDVPGTGCVYPTTAITIGDQVTADGKSWAAYVADQGSEACQHPNSGAKTDLALAQAQPGYDLQHNPFVFFHSLLDAGGCIENDLNLPKLSGALKSPSRTPRFTYVGADACADGDPVLATPLSTGTSTTSSTSTTSTTATSSSTTTAAPSAATVSTTSTTPTTTDSVTTPATSSTTSTTPVTTPATTWGCPAGEPSGAAAENTFLKTWVPQITRSAAYRKDGVLVIAFAGSKRSGHPLRTGAVVLSRYTPAHTKIGATYTPYSLLRSLEDMLNDKPLAHAAGARAFAAATLTKGASS
jgi:hypothetical protein